MSVRSELITTLLSFLLLSGSDSSLLWAQSLSSASAHVFTDTSALARFSPQRRSYQAESLLVDVFSLTGDGPRKPYVPRARYFALGAGYTLPRFLDESSSPLRYWGHAGSVTGGLFWAKPDTSAYHGGHVRFDYGLMSAFNFASAAVDFYRFEGHYRYEKYLQSLWRDRIKWYAGGSVDGLWTLWNFTNFSNNAFNNSFYLSLSPHSTLVYPFQLWQRNFQVSYSAFLPLVTFAIRPAYGTTRLPGFLDDERDEPLQQLLESGKLATLNRFFRYSNTISLEYALRNTNRLRLSYTWNYVRYSEPRLVRSASHNITLSTLFNF